jgi:hypothetical protein
LERSKVTWSEASELFKHRQLWGIYIGQFAIASTLWFFLIWFPTYLVTARHLSIIKAGLYAVIPYIAAFIGVLIGGALSDWLHRRGFSVGTARKVPIIAGLLLASTIVLANYASSINLVIAIMSVAFFAQGMSAISWTLVSDTAPKELMGLAGGVFNFAANLGSIVTPLVIGFVLAATNSFNGGKERDDMTESKANEQKARVLVLHGPNLNKLGVRDPSIYGHTTLATINDRLRTRGAELGYEVVTFQSNHSATNRSPPLSALLRSPVWAGVATSMH